MLTALRHLLAILILPFTVVVIVPRWLLTAWAPRDSRWLAGSATEFIGRTAGAIVFLAGFALFVWCVSLFVRVGRGTLAPWDPTQQLVAVGPYRHVRNPMISAVVTMLAGEALLVGSRVVAEWALLFVGFNHLYFLLSEEPGLQQRFGASYVRYKAAVPRWVPRWHPYTGD